MGQNGSAIRFAPFSFKSMYIVLALSSGNYGSIHNNDCCRYYFPYFDLHKYSDWVSVKKSFYEIPETTYFEYLGEIFFCIDPIHWIFPDNF